MKEYNITGNLSKASVGFITANRRRNKVPKLPYKRQKLHA